MIVSRREAWTGRLLLIVLIVVTIVPFLSLLHDGAPPIASRCRPGSPGPPSRSGATSWRPSTRRNMGALLMSSVLIVLGVVPVAVLIATMAGFAIGHLRIPGSRFLFILFLLGLTLPFEGIIIPLYYLVREPGHSTTRSWPSSCRSSGCTCRSACSGCAPTS